MSQTAFELLICLHNLMRNSDYTHVRPPYKASEIKEMVCVGLLLSVILSALSSRSSGGQSPQRFATLP